MSKMLSLSKHEHLFVAAEEEELFRGETISVAYLTIRDKNLSQFLANTTHQGVFYGDAPRVELGMMLTYIASIEHNIDSYRGHHASMAEAAKPLLVFLKEHFKDAVSRYKATQADGKAAFDLLHMDFKTGDLVYTIRNGVPAAGKVQRTEYHQTFFGSEFKIHVTTIGSNGTKAIIKQDCFAIQAFRSLMDFDQLSVKRVDKTIADTLKARGERFRQWATGKHYLFYTGSLVRDRGWWGKTLFKAEGRIMVDYSNMRRMDPSYFEDRRMNVDEDDDNNGHEASFSSEDDLLICEPRLFAFSFTAKQWGEVNIDQCSAIKFNDKAFDLLVLPDDKKQMVRALVTQADGGFQDIISDKGGGTIFLLHGNPGTGKTLTAEAIAEMLHRPLYMVSVGELGVDPDELEKRLRNILDMASEWNAVVLIDEADIFLEQRAKDDIVRNAMVGVFLRLTEYHQGVLFLTTNRVGEFDHAFHSRISIALKYKDLGDDARKSVWDNLLGAAGISGLDTKTLARHEINGRQIKSAIRLAQALAKDAKEPLSAKHVERTIEVAAQFTQDLRS